MKEREKARQRMVGRSRVKEEVVVVVVVVVDAIMVELIALVGVVLKGLRGQLEEEES